MIQFRPVAVIVAAVASLSACGGAPPPSAASAKTPDEQVSIGAQIFASKCAGCHGEKGEGSSAPKLVGAGALPAQPASGSSRTAQFSTAQDVFTFIRANMPPGDKGSLADDQYYAVLAFALKQNGVALQAKLDAGTAPGISLQR